MPQIPAIPAENTSPNTKFTKKQSFSALPYYKAALAILAQNLRLVAWKIAADMLSRATSFLIAAIVLTTVGTTLFTSPKTLQSPTFITGLTGTACVLWLISLFFNAFAHSGIYASINHTLHQPQPENTPQPKSSFFSNALERLDATLGLQIISFATRTALVLLAATLLLTLLSTFPLHTAALTGKLTTATIWALGIALYMAFTLLTRLTIELIAAPLFIEQRTLSDAILHAAQFVIEYPVQLYRIFVSMLSIMLIPMGIYFLLLMTQNAILMFAPPLATLGLIIRLSADVILFISLAAISVIFYTATFAFYGERRDIWTTSYLEDIMHNPDNSTPKFLKSLFNKPEKPQKRPKNDFSENATLDTLIPSENPNIVAFDKVFDSDVLAHFTPKSTDHNKDDEENYTPSEHDENENPDSPGPDDPPATTPANNSNSASEDDENPNPSE